MEARSVAAGRSRRSLADHAVAPEPGAANGRSKLLERKPGAFAKRAKRLKAKTRAQAKEGETVPGRIGKLQMELESLKKTKFTACSDARECGKLVDHDQRENHDQPVQCELLGLPRSRCTTRPIPGLNPPWGSWPDRCAVFGGSNLSGKPSDGSVLARRRDPISRDLSETSCGAWVYGPSTRSHAPRCQVDPSERFPCRWYLKEVTEVDSRFWANRILPYIHYGRLPATWWPLWTGSPRCFSAGNFPTALTWNSAWRPWKIALTVGRKATDRPLRSRGVSSTSGDFVARLKDRGDQDQAGLVEGAATTTSWWRDYVRTVKYESVPAAPTSDGLGS